MIGERVGTVEGNIITISKNKKYFNNFSYFFPLYIFSDLLHLGLACLSRVFSQASCSSAIIALLDSSILCSSLITCYKYSHIICVSIIILSLKSSWYVCNAQHIYV